MRRSICSRVVGGVWGVWGEGTGLGVEWGEAALVEGMFERVLDAD